MSTEEKIIQPGEAVDVLLDALAKYLIEASKEESFCGVTIDEARDTDGKLLAVSLVMCDNVAGNAARRL